MNNSAAIGYAIMAMESLKIDEKIIEKSCSSNVLRNGYGR